MTTSPAPHNHHRHEHPDAHHAHGDVQAQVLDLDAEVLAGHTAAVAAWLPVRAAPEQIVDLGAGTGAGTFALLSQFPGAEVTAVDSSAAHLERLRARARAANLSDRLRVVQADLDAAEWADLGTPDLVWASASMHHLADPDRALRQVRDLLAPDGLIAVIELAGLPRFLPPTAPEERPGLEERCHAATGQRHAEHMPHRGADWGPKLVTAGFALQDSLTDEVDIRGADHDGVGRYALAALTAVRGAAANALCADDLAALDRLLDTSGPHSILRRDDLALRTTRTVWAARPSNGGTPQAVPARGEAATADGPNEWFSAANEAANCERVLGQRRHGIDTLMAGHVEPRQ